MGRVGELEVCRAVPESPPAGVKVSKTPEPQDCVPQCSGLKDHSFSPVPSATGRSSTLLEVGDLDANLGL